MSIMKAIVRALVSFNQQRPVLVRTNNVIIRHGGQLEKPAGCIGVSFTNLGEVCQVNGYVLNTNGVLVVDTDPGEQDITQYEINFLGPGINKQLSVNFKLTASSNLDL